MLCFMLQTNQFIDRICIAMSLYNIKNKQTLCSGIWDGVDQQADTKVLGSKYKNGIS